jgi:hypothetical protein
VLGGILLIIVITIVAGLIAYAGDRVGHRVGRARLTLFGLRPKHTSTIVAVATGMTIALVMSVLGIGVSQYVRTAFFHIGELNDRVHALQAEADELERHTHDENVVVDRGELLYNSVLTLSREQAPAERGRLLGSFFDATVRAVNEAYGPVHFGTRALRPLQAHSNDPDVKQKLTQLLTDVDAVLVNSPALVLAVADQNMFPNDPIHFRLQAYPDRRIFRQHDVIAVVDISPGMEANPGVALNRLAAAVANEAVKRGMPFYFANPFPIADEEELGRIQRRMARARGAYSIQATAAADIYPHLGEVPIEFQMTAGTAPRT